MQMVQEGKLKLDGVITDYLPDFRADTGGKITIRDLLTHTSGLPMLDDALPAKDGVPGFYSSKDSRFVSPQYVVKTFLQGGLTTAPGAKFNYNNADYVVSSLIMERVTGKPYARLLQNRIFTPLGMRHTALFTGDRISSKQALGYVGDHGKIVAEPYFHIANFGASGALCSTAGDLLLWDSALVGNKLLSKPFSDVMFTPVDGLGYEALGSWVYHASLPGVKPAPLLIERDGAICAFNTLNLLMPEQGYSMIVFSNVDTADLGAVYTRHGLAYDLLKALYSSTNPAPGKD